MEISKSSRHQKIIGNFGENLICNWLSRSGFEVIIVDHTGIDIIAYNPSTKQRLGITVKSRTRDTRKKEGGSIQVFKNGKGDRNKLQKACDAFACEPWIAVYAETSEFADIYLTSLENYNKYCGSGERVVDTWRMGEKDKQHYAEDLKVKHIRFEFLADSWWDNKK